MPLRGRFKKARLFVEWFMGGLKGAAVPDVRVSFAGRHRGSLNLVAPAGSSVSKTVSVDSASAGAVSIPSLSVPQAVSGNVGALTHTAIPQSVTISAPLVPVSGDWGSVVQRGWARCPAFPGLVGNITARVNLVADTAAAAASTYLAVTFRRANGTDIVQLSNSAALTSIAIRPETLGLSVQGEPDGVILNHSLLGNVIRYRVEVRGVQLIVDVLNRAPGDLYPDGQRVALSIDPSTLCEVA